MMFVCFVFFLIGFVFLVGVMGDYVFVNIDIWIDEGFICVLINIVIVGVIVVVIIVFVGVFLVYGVCLLG